VLVFVLQCALASIINNNIGLVGDAYSKPPIAIRSHDLHVGNIRRAMGVIASYYERD